jgi:23S rRNA (adenine1618-N6)-methyltransferase
MADIIEEDLRSSSNIDRNTIRVKGLDIGCGASCIYPLLGVSEYNWRFVGTDIDADSLAWADKNVKNNNFSHVVELRHQKNPSFIFRNIVHANETFSFSICNPPFHATESDAIKASSRKWDNLIINKKKKLTRSSSTQKTLLEGIHSTPSSLLNFGGSSNELFCVGGEIAFLGNIVKESCSQHIRNSVGWFSSLISKQANVPIILNMLKESQACDIKVIEMAQGNKRSRIVAWSYIKHHERISKYRINP